MLDADGQRFDELILNGEVKFESFWIDRSTHNIGVDLDNCYGCLRSESTGRAQPRWDGSGGLARCSCRWRADT